MTVDNSGTTAGFLPTPSARRATVRGCRCPGHHLISTHALREEGDHHHLVWANAHGDFYPRPPRGGRRSSSARFSSRPRFLPTPSARRATCCNSRRFKYRRDFYPRPPRGGRLSSALWPPAMLRFLPTPSARRATDVGHATHKVVEFLPTPSARRATGWGPACFRPCPISTHALREEGDSRMSWLHR